MIKFSQLTKTFGDNTEALRGVTVDIQQGEFVAVLGPSGSGKTTLLRTVNGLVTPSSGTVTVSGMEVVPQNLHKVRKNVGMIFQQFNLVGNLSVINNVLSGSLASHQKWYSGFYFFPKAYRIRALEVIDRVGLLDKAYHRADTLSGGQQQRVGIARALIQKPKVLLADEPIASLDPLISHSILTLLMQICAEDNITVLCTLHQVDFAIRFAQRIIGLTDGKIVFDKKSKDTTTEYIRTIYASNEQGLFFGIETDYSADARLVTWSEYK